MRGVFRRACVAVVALVGAGVLFELPQFELTLPLRDVPCYFVEQDPPGYWVMVCPPV